jgi:hypothetical protein
VFHLAAAGRLQPREPELDLLGADRKAEAGVAPQAEPRADLAVDADHAAAHVDQRSARVAWVDLRVGDDALRVGALRVVQGRDDAGGERRCLVEDAEAEGIADGQCLVADGERLGVAEFEVRHGLPLFQLELEGGEVTVRVGTEQLGPERAAVAQPHGIGPLPLDDVVVGEHEAVGTDDHATPALHEHEGRANLRAQFHEIGRRPRGGAGKQHEGHATGDHRFSPSVTWMTRVSSVESTPSNVSPGLSDCLSRLMSSIVSTSRPAIRRRGPPPLRCTRISTT